MVIYKYEFQIRESFSIEMPEWARIIKVEEQRGVPCIWAIVNPKIKPVSYRFVLRGTGHPLDGILLDNYVGTFQSGGGMFVWHLFTK